jgi:hypothetical protein
MVSFGCGQPALWNSAASYRFLKRRSPTGVVAEPNSDLRPALPKEPDAPFSRKPRLPVPASHPVRAVQSRTAILGISLRRREGGEATPTTAGNRAKIPFISLPGRMNHLKKKQLILRDQPFFDNPKKYLRSLNDDFKFHVSLRPGRLFSQDLDPYPVSFFPGKKLDPHVVKTLHGHLIESKDPIPFL